MRSSRPRIPPQGEALANSSVSVPHPRGGNPRSAPGRALVPMLSSRLAQRRRMPTSGLDTAARSITGDPCSGNTAPAPRRQGGRRRGADDGRSLHTQHHGESRLTAWRTARRARHGGRPRVPRRASHVAAARGRIVVGERQLEPRRSALRRHGAGERRAAGRDGLESRTLGRDNVAAELNPPPRKRHAPHTPAEVLDKLLAKPTVLRDY
jgi:hypothetical protein